MLHKEIKKLAVKNMTDRRSCEKSLDVGLLDAELNHRLNAAAAGAMQNRMLYKSLNLLT